MGDSKERKRESKPKGFQMRLPFRTGAAKLVGLYQNGKLQGQASKLDEGAVVSPYVRGSILKERR